MTCHVGAMQSVFKQSPPAGCQLAVCARYPDAVRIPSWKNQVSDAAALRVASTCLKCNKKGWD